MIIKKAGVKPIFFKLCSFVLAPTAASAINKHHLLASIKKRLAEFGIKPKILTNPNNIIKQQNLEGEIPLVILRFNLAILKLPGI